MRVCVLASLLVCFGTGSCFGAVYETQRIAATDRLTVYGAHAFDGTTLLVYSRQYSRNDDNSVISFSEDKQGSFAPSQTIYGPGYGYEVDGFGSPSSVSGDFALMGAPGYDSSAGESYLYQRVDNAWTRLMGFSPYAYHDSKAMYSGFGAAVDLEDKAMIVGAPGEFGRDLYPHPLAPNEGAAYVYTTDTNWNDG